MEEWRERMDREGWTEERMDGMRMDKGSDEGMDRWINSWISTWVNGRKEGKIYRGWMDDEQKDGG